MIASRASFFSFSRQITKKPRPRTCFVSLCFLLAKNEGKLENAKSIARGREVSHTQTEEGKMLVGSARSVDHFEKLEQIGEGTYGQVREQRETSRGVTSVNVVHLEACAQKKKKNPLLVFPLLSPHIPTLTVVPSFLSFPLLLLVGTRK